MAVDPMGANSRKAFLGKSSRTPGPWHTASSMLGMRIINGDGVCVAKMPTIDRQAVADAALIAKAPALLDALKTVIRIADETPLQPAVLVLGKLPEDIRDLVAMAEGEA